MKKLILLLALLLFVTESFVFAQTEVKIDSFEQNGKKIKTVKVTAQYNDAEKTSDKGKKFATFKVSVDKNGNNINIDSSGSIDLNDINTEDIKSIKVIKKKKSKNDNADIDIMTWDEKGEQNDDGEIEIDLKEKGKKIRLVKVETSPTVSEKIYSIGEGDNKFLKRIYITPTTKKITYIVKDKQWPNKEKEIIVYYKTPTTERRYFPSGDNDFNEFEFVVADDDNQFAPPPPPP
ncbi:MAG: hypothetical protein ORN85_09760, partial [Sediminibacterium sp.]|nr:hypothetical protein [Sediminibacterium sp.]